MFMTNNIHILGGSFWHWKKNRRIFLVIIYLFFIYFLSTKFIFWEINLYNSKKHWHFIPSTKPPHNKHTYVNYHISTYHGVCCISLGSLHNFSLDGWSWVRHGPPALVWRSSNSCCMRTCYFKLVQWAELRLQ